MAEDILREEGLPATTPRYQYQDVEQCLRCFELELERYDKDGKPGAYSYIIFDHVDNSSFHECFEGESTESLLTHSLVTYNFISHIVVLKILTPIHEAAHRAFSDIFATWHRGQERRLLPRGGTAVEGFTRKKYPDSSWTTSVHVPGRDVKWPTILVEAGWSESRAKLEQDVLFWLRESQQQVKVTLTIKVTPRGQIIIERWASKKAGPVTSVVPIETMRITRSRRSNTNQHPISGSMHIRFEDCFLCPRELNETDFVLSNDDMTEIAEAVWSCLPEWPVLTTPQPLLLCCQCPNFRIEHLHFPSCLRCQKTFPHQRLVMRHCYSFLHHR